VPNLAKREHLKNLPILLRKLKTYDLRTIDLITVTVGPGLEPALWTGINFAKDLAAQFKKPLIGVNHMEGHLFSCWLPMKVKKSKIVFPAIALIVSGGHTILLYMKAINKWTKLGETLDDAAGEAFDKVGRMLGLPYPGGPEIQKLAAKGNPKAIKFPRPMLNKPGYEFSFSGLKTSVLYYLRDHTKAKKADVAASFQRAVIDVLVKKTARAAEEYKAKSVLLCGGVSANALLRNELKVESEKLKVKNLTLVCGNYNDIGAMAGERCGKEVDGILFDLGFGSHHLEKSGRGFSFKKDEPLDMRYNILNNELTAEKIINLWDREAIENLFREYGEERFTGRITRGILRERKKKKITTTGELTKIVAQNVPVWYLKRKNHPATKIFQALRIAVNKELENLESVLPKAVKLLKLSGKLIIISFHSLEDRIIKNFFKEKDKEGILKILTGKPLVSSVQEVKINPRSRSAKLRAAERLS
jgi:tRNA threonylcarbamoyl adenosine modification protein TsaD